MRCHRHHAIQGSGPAMIVSLRGEQGVSLIEVMVAAVMALLIIGAGFTAVISADKSMRVNDAVADTQQNARIAMELLARDVKMAGFGMTGPVGACTVAGNAMPIIPADNTPAGNDTGPDAVSMVLPVSNSNAAVGPLWQLNLQASGPFSTITVRAGAGAAMVAQGMGVGSTVSIGGAVSGTITAIAGDLITLQNQIGPPKVFPVGTQVFLLQCITYQVIRAGDANAAACGGTVPCLVRGVADIVAPFTNTNCNLTLPNNCVEVVEGVEDVQLAYACDGCNAAVNGGAPDGIPDDWNGNNTFDVADFVTNNTWATTPMTPDKIRLVQINVVARQTRQDQGLNEVGTRATSSAAPLQVSDHNHSNDVGYSFATYQVERRRALARAVKTRNMGP